jgi:hypothetical protein
MFYAAVLRRRIGLPCLSKLLGILLKSGAAAPGGNGWLAWFAGAWVAGAWFATTAWVVAGVGGFPEKPLCSFISAS